MQELASQQLTEKHRGARRGRNRPGLVGPGWSAWPVLSPGGGGGGGGGGVRCPWSDRNTAGAASAPDHLLHAEGAAARSAGHGALFTGPELDPPSMEPHPLDPTPEEAVAGGCGAHGPTAVPRAPLPRPAEAP
jgi:hypothetical protein